VSTVLVNTLTAAGVRGAAHIVAHNAGLRPLELRASIEIECESDVARDLAAALLVYASQQPDDRVAVILDGRPAGRMSPEVEREVRADGVVALAEERLQGHGPITQVRGLHGVAVRTLSLRGAHGVITALVGIAKVYERDGRERVEGGADVAARFLTADAARKFRDSVVNVARARDDWSIRTVTRETVY
jgi:hypothetical protein